MVSILLICRLVVMWYAQLGLLLFFFFFCSDENDSAFTAVKCLSNLDVSLVDLC